MFSCICNEIIKDTDHIVIKHWFKVFSQLTKFINSILRCIKYKNTVVEFFDEIKCSVIQRTCVTTGFHHKKCCIFVCNFKWAMEKFTRMDNTCINPLHLHKDTDCFLMCRSPAGAAAHRIDYSMPI